jgi:3-oxoacyl-[acyl-carrier protein] reductase
MKSAVVTGSSRGIGRAIARRLSKNHKVWITGRSKNDVSAFSEEIGGTGFSGDLTETGCVSQLAASFAREHGSLDLLVLNLGSGKAPSGLKISKNQLSDVFNLNFFSAVDICSQFEPLMAPGSNIIFISSIAGCENIGAPPAYSAAKAALLSYMKASSKLLAHKKIRVNAVSPGNIMFEGGTWDVKNQADAEGVNAYIAKEVPLNMFGSPDDIASAVEFIINSPFMTGHNLIIDGGQTRKI